MIVLVTGGREFSGIEALERALTLLRAQVPREKGLLVVQGGARGADSIAHGWAVNMAQANDPPLVRHRTFAADWLKSRDCAGHTHSRFGSGPCRNARMVSWVKAALSDHKLVLACPGGTGTDDCVDKALAAGLTVKTLDEVLKEYGP